MTTDSQPQIDQNNTEQSPEASKGFRYDLAILALFTLVLFILAIFHEQVNPLLSFDRDAILAGEWWRILSCNIVHLGVNHSLLNLSVFVLSSVIFAKQLSLRLWYSITCICSVSVGLGIYYFDKGISNYVGLSGALYGLIAFAALSQVKESPVVSLILAAYVYYKVISQQLASFDDNHMREFIGGAVVESSHLFGLIAGTVCISVIFLWNLRAKIFQLTHSKD